MADHAALLLAAIEDLEGSDPGSLPDTRAALDALVADKDGSEFLKNCAEAALLKEQNLRVAAEAERDRLREALQETAVYIAVCRASRHGKPAGDDCPRCLSDQRELDRIGSALAAEKTT